MPTGLLGAKRLMPQRRIGRPQDGDNDGTAACDKGAVERFYPEVDPLFANGFED